MIVAGSRGEASRANSGCSKWYRNSQGFRGARPEFWQIPLQYYDSETGSASLGRLAAIRPLEPIDALPRRRVSHEIQFAVLVLTKGHDRDAGVGDWPVGDDPFLGGVVLQGPDLVCDVVGVEIVADQLGQAFAAIDGAAGHRLADVVAVFPNRLDQVGARADALGAERVETFAQV